MYVCVALIAQQVRAFGVNPKVGGSSPLQVKTFSVSKTLTLSQEHTFVCRKWMAVAHAVNISNVNFTLKNIYTARASVWKTWGSKCLALIAYQFWAFGMNPTVGGSSPPQVETFSVSKLWHFHKNTRSCVENECCCPRAVNISNVNFTSKISIPPEPVLKNMGQQMSGPDSPTV